MYTDTREPTLRQHQVCVRVRTGRQLEEEEEKKREPTIETAQNTVGVIHETDLHTCADVH